MPVSRFHCWLGRASAGALIWSACLSPMAAAPPVAAAEPKPGMVLVAARDTGGAFRRSIVYMLSHDDTGSFGVIVNRQSRVTLAELLPSFKSSPAPSYGVRYGGPVALQALKFLIHESDPVDDAIRITSDVHASGSPELLQRLVDERFDAARLRIFAGYAGWAPGQLRGELERGAWYVIGLATSKVFSADETLWKTMIERLDPPGLRVRGPTGKRLL